MKKCVDLTRSRRAACTTAGRSRATSSSAARRLRRRRRRPGPPRQHRAVRRRDARFGRRVAGQDRVPRPEGGLADVQEERRRARRRSTGPLRQLLGSSTASSRGHARRPASADVKYQSRFTSELTRGAGGGNRARQKLQAAHLAGDAAASWRSIAAGSPGPGVP